VSSLGALGRRRITADIVVQLVGRALNLLLGVVVTVILVRHLGEDGFGKWSTMLAVIGLVGAAGSQALAKVGIPRAAADPEREGAWLASLVQLQALIAVPAMLIAFTVLMVISRGSDMREASVLIVCTIALNILSAVGAVFQLRVRNDISIAVLTLNSLLWAAAVIAITSADGSLPALAAAFLVASAIPAAVSAALGLRRAHFDWARGRQLWAPVLKMMIPVTLFGIATTAYNQIDQIIVFEIAGSSDSGLYGSVYRILDQAGLFPAAVVTTLTPVLAAAYVVDLGRVRRLLQAAADNLGIISMGAVAVAIGAGAPILELLYGENFGSAAPALALLMVAYVAICFGYVFGSMVVIMALQGRLLRFALLALTVNVSLNLIFVPIFGYIAAAAVTIVTEALILFLTVRMVGPILEFRLSWPRLIRIGLAAAGMTGLLLLLRSADVAVGWLIAAAAVSYPALLFALRALRPRELLSLVTER
jgi:O-antigen/teichoic acid export membrane protein